MPSPTRAELAGYAVCALMVAILGWRALRASAPPAGAKQAAPLQVRASPRAAARASLLVHVVGAVRRPGVYELREGDRLRDALRLAGGATATAQLAAVNLAAKATDGQQVVVPRGGAGARAVPPPPAAGAAAAGGSAASPGVGRAEGAAPAAGAGPPVSLNGATPVELETLDGIGPALAAKIVAGRPYRAIDDLAAVPGIGPKRLAAIRGRVTL